MTATNWDDGSVATLPLLLPGPFVFRIRATDEGLIADEPESGVVMVGPSDQRRVLHVHALYADRDGAPVVELAPGEELQLTSPDGGSIEGDPDALDATALEIRFKDPYPCSCAGGGKGREDVRASSSRPEHDGCGA